MYGVDDEINRNLGMLFLLDGQDKYIGDLSMAVRGFDKDLELVIDPLRRGMVIIHKPTGIKSNRIKVNPAAFMNEVKLNRDELLEARRAIVEVYTQIRVFRELEGR